VAKYARTYLRRYIHKKIIQKQKKEKQKKGVGEAKIERLEVGGGEGGKKRKTEVKC